MVQHIDVLPVFFADDALLMLLGDRIQDIINMVDKIKEYGRVSGLQLNPRKCEFLAFNCNENHIQDLAQQTQMKRVQVLKHLGLKINRFGKLAVDDNITPILNTMRKIADSFNTNLSTPLGRAIYAKFLLSSRYIHKIQNYVFSEQNLDELWNVVRIMTWTRARPKSNNSSIRVHIAKDRVAQPMEFGGLALSDPKHQVKSLTFAWVRKFTMPDLRLVWIQILDLMLSRQNRPTAAVHTKLGVSEWRKSADLLQNESSYWEHVFRSIAEILELEHRYDVCWVDVPILGYEGMGDMQTYASLHYRNPTVRTMFDNGLICVGQLFSLGRDGFVDPNLRKSFDQIENEFNVVLPIPVRNSITGLCTKVKETFRQQMLTTHVLVSTTTSLVRMTQKTKAGCNQITRLLLKADRELWTWGPVPKSFTTYSADQIINIDADSFRRALKGIRKNVLMPSVQWTSLSICLRTLWTKVKQAKRNQIVGPVDVACSNCNAEPETTTHLVYECILAQQMLTRYFNIVDQIISERSGSRQVTNWSVDAVLFHHLPDIHNDYRQLVIEGLMLIKHALVRLKYRPDIHRLPTLRRLTLLIILDIDNYIMCRETVPNKPSWFFSEMQTQMKELIGLS